MVKIPSRQRITCHMLNEMDDSEHITFYFVRGGSRQGRVQ